MIYKILIVDDSKLARMSVIKVLTALHPQWLRWEAANADEAIRRFNEQAPDVVLLDFNMPGVDGLVLAAQLRRLNPGVHLAVISANRQTELITRARAIGAAFIAKPLTESALNEFLNSALAEGDSATP